MEAVLGSISPVYPSGEIGGSGVEILSRCEMKIENHKKNKKLKIKLNRFFFGFV